MWPLNLLYSSKNRKERRAARRLQRPNHRRRARVVLGLEPLEDRLAPATDMVINRDSSGPGSLSYEVANAQAGDVIVFQQGLKGIITPDGTSLAAVEISKNLNIQGPGADVLTISGGGAGRVFYVDTGVTASISGLGISNGRPSVPAGLGTFGGGIANFGNLILISVEVNNNSIFPSGGDNSGAGIANYGTLSLTASTVDHNTINSVGVGNTSNAKGGGIYNGPLGRLDMVNDTVDDNTILGGKIAEGGGVYNDAPPNPTQGTGASMTNVTIANNLTAGGTSDGDGIYNAGGTLNAAPLTIFNSIVYNPNAIGPNPDVSGQIFWDGGNLFGSTVLTQIKTSSGQDQFNKNPLLGTLEDNGGPTETMALLSGSPALGGGLAGGGTWPSIDQRGFPRPSNIIDIGAYETENPDTTTNLVASSTSLQSGQSVTLTATVRFGAPSSNTTPGTVTFYNDGIALGTVTLTNGSASMNTMLPVGNNIISATYSGISVGAFVLQPSTYTVIIAVSPAPTPSSPPVPPPPAPPAPVGGLSMFAYGFGPGSQLDIFEVDQTGQVFAMPVIDLFGGHEDMSFISNSVAIGELVLQDEGILGILLGSNNQTFLMKILSLSDPHVFNAALNAWLSEHNVSHPQPTGGTTGETSSSPPVQSGPTPTPPVQFIPGLKGSVTIQIPAHLQLTINPGTPNVAVADLDGAGTVTITGDGNAEDPVDFSGTVKLTQDVPLNGVKYSGTYTFGGQAKVTGRDHVSRPDVYGGGILTIQSATGLNLEFTVPPGWEIRTVAPQYSQWSFLGGVQRSTTTPAGILVAGNFGL